MIDAPPIQWALLRQYLATWKQGQQLTAERPLDPWSICQKFDDLLTYVAAQFGEDSGGRKQELAPAMALLALGPEDQDPPDSIWRNLCRQAAEPPISRPKKRARLTHTDADESRQSYADDDPERWRDIVIAWGCGWRR